MVDDHGITLVTKVLLAVIVVFVAVYDVRERRIPNLIVFPAVAAGLLVNSLHGWSGMAFGICGLGAGIGLLLIPYLFRIMGAGDVKFLGAIGSFLGAWGAVRVLLITLLVYPLIALVFVGFQGKWKLTTVRFLRLLLKPAVTLVPLIGALEMRLANHDAPGESSATTPFGAILGVGTLVALLTHFLV